jgi:hypothetical protein
LSDYALILCDISFFNLSQSFLCLFKIGFLSVSDIDAIFRPGAVEKNSGLYKITVDDTGHVSATTAVIKDDITALGIPASDTTYTVATTSKSGLMDSSDKSKLDGIEAGANKITVDSSLNSTSTNPV